MQCFKEKCRTVLLWASLQSIPIQPPEYSVARHTGEPKQNARKAFWEGRRDEVVQSWIADGIELYKKLDMIDIIPVWCTGMDLDFSKRIGLGDMAFLAQEWLATTE